MQQYVPVRVPLKAFCVGNSGAANLERNPASEFVRVPSITDSHNETLAAEEDRFFPTDLARFKPILVLVIPCYPKFPGGREST
jgi:hypothetical protein